MVGRCKLKELFSVSLRLRMGRYLREGLEHEVVEGDGRLSHLFLALFVKLELQSKRCEIRRETLLEGSLDK